MQDNVNEIIEKIANRIIKFYKLNPKEEEDFRKAIINYDYEINEGVVYTTRESVERLYMEDDEVTPIKFTEKQLKAIAEFIYATENYYSVGTGDLFDKYTKQTVLNILNNKENVKSNKTRELNNGIYVIDLGYRRNEPIALVERTIDSNNKEYIIAFNYKIKDNNMDWGYGYYYNENIEKAKEDFKKVLAGGNLADTFTKKNKNKDAR